MCRMLNGVAATFVLIYSGTKLAIFFLIQARDLGQIVYLRVVK